MDDFQYDEEYSIRCLESNRHNHITATYHLINKKNQRNQYMREAFSPKGKAGDETKRDMLKSQGQPNAHPTDLNIVKPPARKRIEEDLNQTIYSPVPKTKIADELLEIQIPDKSRVAGSEAPQNRRDTT
jgi:hypothetical protein